MWEGAPCSTLPTVGENAVTESAWSVLGCVGFALCLAVWGLLCAWLYGVCSVLGCMGFALCLAVWGLLCAWLCGVCSVLGCMGFALCLAV